MKLPDTINYPDAYNKSKTPWHDGDIYWQWLIDGCKGTNIKPMDIDAIIERKGCFLVVESKEINVPIPLGQMITLNRLWALGIVSTIFVWGKEVPTYAEIRISRTWGGRFYIINNDNVGKRLTEFVKWWLLKANKDGDKLLCDVCMTPFSVDMKVLLENNKINCQKCNQTYRYAGGIKLWPRGEQYELLRRYAMGKIAGFSTYKEE